MGSAALAAIDQALAAQSLRDTGTLMAAIEALCAMREELIAAKRAGDQSDRLGRLNAIISSTLNAQFPTEKVSWPLIQSARNSLHDMLA